MKLEEVKSDSGNILSAGYEDGTLVINFKNGSYRAKNVPPEAWEDFRATFQTDDSTGSHFHRHLRDQYDFERLSD